jgi:beta-mannosidase
MRRSRTSLRTGWLLRDADNNTPEAWLPVEKAPSSVHVDLLANGKYVKPHSNCTAQFA